MSQDIKVKSFRNSNLEDLDKEMEDFIKDYSIKREDIIKIYFYAAVTIATKVHVAKLVYESDFTTTR